MTSVADIREPHGAMTARIRGLTPSLSRTGKSIAAVITADPAAVIRMTVSDLAAASATSVGSVVRFCQDLGLRGYQDLKLEIAAEVRAPQNGGLLHPADSPLAVLTSTVESSARAITEALATIDTEAFRLAAEAVNLAQTVLVIGVGTSAPLAQDAAYRLIATGIPSTAPVDVHQQHVAARLLTPRDVCLAVSHTGQTREVLLSMTAAQRTGATTIAVTSFFRSPLSELCRHVLVAGSAETQYRVEAMTSRFAHLAVLDALHSAVFHANPARSTKATQLVADAIAEHRL